MQSQKAVIKTEDYRLSAVEEARKAYEQEPELATNIFKLADALPDAETLEQARIDLTGPNAELMQTVSTVLLDNLFYDPVCQWMDQASLLGKRNDFGGRDEAMFWMRPA